jgi:TolB-like protein
LLHPSVYRFGNFELDLDRAELRVGGTVRPVEPQVFALLALLVENRERLLSRDELVEKVWDGRAVSDSAVSSRIKSLRRALGDDGRTQGFIRTLHGQGFRFVAPVEAAPAPALDLEPGPASGRPSLAVLPFRPVGDAVPSGALAEALPHELIADLARLRWLLVTARGSAFRLRGPRATPEEAGRRLGVRYVLTGTVEASGRRLALTAELTDTRNGEVVWGERYTGALDDVHALRAELRGRILAALELRIPLHEGQLARHVGTEDLDAWSAFHLGLQHMYNFNRRDNAAATALFTRALALDPAFARAHAGLSFLHFQTAFLRDTEDLSGEVRAARRFAERGFELDPLDPFVNFTLGRSYWLEGDLDTSLQWLERATAISPHYAQGLYAQAWTETLAGRGGEGRAHVDLAMRLSPLDPLHYGMLGTRAFTHMAQGEDEEAARWAERAARDPGAHVLIALIAAVAHDLAGRGPEAARWAAQVRARNRGLTREDFFRAFPIKPEGMRARVESALRGLGF